MRIIDLPYIHVNGAVKQSPYGFQEVEEVKYYDGVKIRNRVVVRLDVIKGLTDAFSEETRNKFRMVVYNIIAGNVTDQLQVSDILKALYVGDETFRAFLGEIVYFDTNLENEPLYDVLVKKLLMQYRERRDFLNQFVQNMNYKQLIESKGYLYITVSDVSQVATVPNDCGEEVISRASVWNGQFKRV